MSALTGIAIALLAALLIRQLDLWDRLNHRLTVWRTQCSLASLSLGRLVFAAALTAFVWVVVALLLSAADLALPQPTHP